MEPAAEVIKTIADSMLVVGLISVFVGGACGIYMQTRAVRRTRQAKASTLDVMYLCSSSPGFSRISMFNAADSFGIGIYTALALEQVGAIKDIEPQTQVNLRLYPERHTTYLAAARYHALIGEKQKAEQYLSIADTLAGDSKVKVDIPLLEKSTIQALFKPDAQMPVDKNSVIKMYEELRKKPHLLLVARSVKLLLIGLGALLLGMLFYIIRSFIL